MAGGSASARSDSACCKAAGGGGGVMANGSWRISWPARSLLMAACISQWLASAWRGGSIVMAMWLMSAALNMKILASIIY